MVRAETNAGYGLAGPVFMFVIWGLHGEAGCHWGVATGFFVAGHSGLGLSLGLDRRWQGSHSLAHRQPVQRSDEPIFPPQGFQKGPPRCCTSRRVFSFPPSEENAGFRPRNATRLRTPQTALVMDAHEPTREQGLRKGTHPG